MKKGKKANINGIALSYKTTTKGLKEGDSYKYLGVIQANGMKHHKESQNRKERKSQNRVL